MTNTIDITNTIIGIAASEGIAIAKAFRLEPPELTVEKTAVTDTDAEVGRFEEGLPRGWV